MCLGLVLADVVEVVGDDERQADLRGEAQELFVQPALLGQAVVLELQEEAVRAEDVLVLAGDVRASSQSSTSSALATSPPRHAREADQALAVPGEVLTVDARLVVVAVDVGIGDHPAEVLIPR